MPYYNAGCPKCGNEQDYFSKIADYDKTPACKECGTTTVRLLSAPMITAMGLADHAAIRSPIDGKMLYGRSDYYKHMKEHGVLPESDLQGEVEHQRKQNDVRDKKERRESIIKSLAQHGVT